MAAMKHKRDRIGADPTTFGLYSANKIYDTHSPRDKIFTFDPTLDTWMTKKCLPKKRSVKFAEPKLVIITGMYIPFQKGIEQKS